MLMETGTDRTGAFYEIIIWIQTIIVMAFVYFVYYDIQLTKMNKQVNKEQKIISKWKPRNLDYCNGRTCYLWVQTKHQELISRYNWFWKQVVGFVTLYNPYVPKKNY